MGDTHDQSSRQKSGSDTRHDKASWITKIMGAETSSTATQTETHAKAKIQKIPLMLRDTKEFEKYYVPRVVSLGPYHHGKSKLNFIQDLKPKITKKFVKGDQNTLDSLYVKLKGKIEEVRNCYEENSTGDFTDHQFTCMMLEDGCFILYCIDNTCISQTTESSVEEDGQSKELGLKSHHIAFIQQDLFLLENQVPYMVLEELMSVGKNEQRWQGAITRFIKNHNFMASEKVQKGWCNPKIFSNCWGGGSSDPGSHDKGKSISTQPAHLLELLQVRLVGKQLEPSRCRIKGGSDSRYTFRNVNELLTVGIHFRPSKTDCLANIQYKSCGLSAYLELPTIMVDDSTRPMLLNMVAFEMCSNVPNESWVTSYICFLDSLIDHTDDVKELRKARILDNSLGSDEEVAKLFNEIGTDLVPNPYTYADAKSKIQKHYQSTGKTWATQLRHEYFSTPWSVLALVGAVVALFLSGVQAYFSVWSYPGECDNLCKYIKQNHHL